MFASVGADGSVRMFDLRHLEHSTIIYEDPQHHPLLRLAWNKQDPNYLSTMAMDSFEVKLTLLLLVCFLRIPTHTSLTENATKSCIYSLDEFLFTHNQFPPATIEPDKQGWWEN